MAEPFGGPVTAFIYGEPGYGKSTDGCFSFPNALFVGEVGGLRAAQTVCGYAIDRASVVPARTIKDITRLVQQASGRPLYVDDFTLIAEATFAEYEKRYSGFDLFKAIRQDLLEFRDVVRHGSSHVVVNGHERHPHTDKLSGDYILGGPKLPGKMPQELPGAFDIILRCTPSPYVSVNGGPPSATPFTPALMMLGWKNVYYNSLSSADRAFATKDRLNVCWESTPMNIGEVLRVRGYELPRLRILPWQEEVVEWIAQGVHMRITEQVRDPTAFVEILKAARKHMEEKHKAIPQHVAWTFRDGVARAILRVMISARASSAFFGA